MISGTIRELWRYPVKSMQGERQDVARIDDRGFGGDRTYALRDRETGKIASAKHPRLWGQLLLCSARIVSPAGAVRITLPDGRQVTTGQDDVDAALCGADAASGSTGGGYRYPASNRRAQSSARARAEWRADAVSGHLCLGGARWYRACGRYGAGEGLRSTNPYVYAASDCAPRNTRTASSTCFCRKKRIRWPPSKAINLEPCMPACISSAA